MVPFSSLTVETWVELGKPTKGEYETLMADHERKSGELEARKRELLRELKREVEPLEREKARAENPYGRCGVIGGGAVPGSRYVPPEQREEQWRKGFAERFNNRPTNPYGLRHSIDRGETERYTTGRFIEHIRGEIARVAGYTR